MALSDEELLSFDLKQLGGFKKSPHSLLAEHGDVYRAQLVTARWLDGYRERRARPSITKDERFEAGALDTLSDIAAHLRQGDFLPGGTLYEDEIEGRFR
jgi:hypothetical protein